MRVPSLILLGLSAVCLPLKLVCAEEPLNTVVGALTCDITSKVGGELKPDQDVACRFSNAADQIVTPYIGRVVDKGIDFGEIVGGQLRWLVLSRDAPVTTLVDSYRTINAPVTLGLPKETRVLAGVSQGDVVLQPYVRPGSDDPNISAGVTSLILRK